MACAALSSVLACCAGLTALDVDPDTGVVASGSEDGTLCLSSPATGRILCCTQGVRSPSSKHEPLLLSSVSCPACLLGKRHCLRLLRLMMRSHCVTTPWPG